MPSQMRITDIGAPYNPTKRSDMDKFGLFLEMGFLRSEIPYIAQEHAGEFRPEARKGNQMLCGAAKTKAAKRDCYFDKVERRVFEGDGTTDPVRARHQAQIDSRKLDVGGKWVPPRGKIDHNGVNTFYDTFAGRVSAFSFAMKPRPLKQRYLPDFVAGAPKKGTLGWTGFTFSKFPEHLPDPYDGAPLKKRNIETTIDTETSMHMKRPPFSPAAGIRKYFNPNPYLVESSLIEPEPKPQKPKLVSQHASAFIPPGRPKPLGSSYKHWGAFHPVDDLGGNYVEASRNPFRPEFHGKQNLANPFIPPSGSKSVLIPAVTIVNMAGQMDMRRADKQEIVYGENAKSKPPFPNSQIALARMEAKNVRINPKLYRKPETVLQVIPAKDTKAPLNKPWFN